MTATMFRAINLVIVINISLAVYSRPAIPSTLNLQTKTLWYGFSHIS